jgi:hypothetical protein
MPEWLVGEIAEENKLPICTRTLIVHGRTSTNEESLANVHPFMRKGRYAFAHNGVLNWTGTKEAEPKFSCDSEQFFDWQTKNGWDHSNEFFSGYGAIALGDIATGTLTIARDTASLYIARRADHKGWLMATSEHHLIAIAKRASIRLDTKPLAFPNMKLATFGTSNRIVVRDWKGFAASRWGRTEQASMGTISPTAGKVTYYGKTEQEAITGTGVDGETVTQGTVDDVNRYKRYYRGNPIRTQLDSDAAERRQLQS